MAAVSSQGHVSVAGLTPLAACPPCLLPSCCCSGHGGPNAADYVRSNLFINLLEHTKFTTDIASALGEL
jgi:hypothetical protein